MKPSPKWLGLAIAVCSSRFLTNAGVLDQQFMPTNNAGLIVEQSQTLAQTFQVGLAGVLNRIEVEVARYPTLPPDGMILEIRTTLPNGSPAATLLGSVPIATDSVPTAFGFVGVDLDNFNLAVNAGDVLALVLRSNLQDLHGGIDPFAWCEDGPGTYSHGAGYLISPNLNSFIQVGTDFGFRTYITTVPEPSAAMLIFGSGVLLACRRRDGPEKNPAISLMV